MKLGPNQTRWIEALESGNYKQGRSYLHAIEGGYCCLGVGCSLFLGPGELSYGSDYEPPHEKWDGSSAFASDELVEILGLYGKDGRARDPRLTPLSAMNDQGISFMEIAKKLRNTPALYLKETR